MIISQPVVSTILDYLTETYDATIECAKNTYTISGHPVLNRIWSMDELEDVVLQFNNQFVDYLLDDENNDFFDQGFDTGSKIFEISPDNALIKLINTQYQPSFDPDQPYKQEISSKTFEVYFPLTDGDFSIGAMDMITYVYTITISQYMSDRHMITISDAFGREKEIHIIV